MIHFKAVRWKNFLSTGSEYLEIQLDRTPSTLIVGQNGAGKSTLLDALSFGLFGKAHRDIKKDQLINSINKKQTMVEVEFQTGGQDFKIIRGIRPGKFEIWQNNRQINQASNARDHQKFLEQNILKLNHKSFHQIVVLGSSSFIPFMQLPAWSRRDVIEDLLDINVFSKMNQILKERNATIKNNLVDINHNLELVKTKMLAQEKYIKDLNNIKYHSVSPELVVELDYSENTLQNEFCKFVPMTVTSEFPHGHSLSMGRSILYYSEYICNHLESSLRTGDIVFKFSTKMNDNDDYDISITTDSMYKDSDITSVILDVFDFNLTKFTNEIKGYDVIKDITNPFNNKPWLVKDKSRDIFII